MLKNTLFFIKNSLTLDDLLYLLINEQISRQKPLRGVK